MKLGINYCLLAFILLSINSFKAQNQTTGISQELANYVNPFTGDFTYSLGLINISGPNGESYPINLGYAGGGVKMNQEAGWVGLGWDITSMEISRTVNGIPDDWKGKLVSTYNETGGQEIKKYYGPIYFKDADYANINNPLVPKTTFDIYQSFKYTDDGTSPFEFPDYDEFNVNVPGVSGKMSPKLFDFATLPHSDVAESSDTEDWTFGDYTGENKEFSKRPEFIYFNQGNTQVLAPYYSETNYDENCNCYPPSNRLISYFDLAGESPSYGAFLDPSELDAQSNPANDYYGHYSNNGGKNRMTTATYVEYFTNAQINSFDPTSSQGYNELDAVGFLDFRTIAGSSVRRPSTEYDPDGIGAFQITDAKGLVYHFSLPIYTRSEKITSYNLDDNDEVLSLKDVGIKNDMYARSWKLTAITGPDYIDANNNGIADEGDAGYWITFNYSVFAKDIYWKFPYYGVNKDQSSKRHPDQFLARKGYENYQRRGSVSEGRTDHVYLDYIQTSTQTLVFIKDVRNDGHSSKNPTSHIIFPKLYLKKILLFSNEQYNSSLFDNSVKPIGEWSSTFQNDIFENTINWQQYLQNKTNIDPLVLSGAEFIYDYSLQKGVYNNIKNSFSTITKGILGFNYEDITSSSIGASGSGKLTLKDVQFLEYQNTVFSPPYKFSYNVNNPNYNFDRTDFFGYYKNNASYINSKYLSDNDAQYVDAWMLNKIVNPVGGLLNMEYESDEYEGVGYDSKNGLPAQVTKYFKIKEVTGSANYPDFEFYENNVQDFYNSAHFDKKQIYIKYTADCGPVEVIDDGTISGSFSFSANGNSVFTVDNGTGNIACGSVQNYVKLDGMGYMKMYMSGAYGGGVRVKRISITEPEQNVTYSTEVEYHQGIVTTEPDAYGPDNGGVLQATKHGGDRHAFTPLVGYSGTSFKYIGADGTVLGSTRLNHFNYVDTYRPTVVKAEQIINHPGNNIPQHYINYEVVHITENNSLFGKIRSKKIFDTNGKVVSSSLYEYGEGEYLDDDYRVDEVYYRKMRTNINTDVYSNFQTIFYKTQRANNLRKEITTTDGLETVTLYENYDAITGVPQRIRIVNGTASNMFRGMQNNRKLVYNDPLYYTMGPKSIDPANKNILIPVQASKIFSKAYSGDLMDGMKKNWSNVADFMELNSTSLIKERVSKPSLWYPVNQSVYNGAQNEDDWKRVSEVTLLNEKNLPAEVKNVDDYYASERLGYNNRFTVSKASNSNYNSYTHETFENASQIDNNLVIYDGDLIGEDLRVLSNSTITSHTGKYYVQLVPGQNNYPEYKSFVEDVSRPALNDVLVKGMHTGRKYRASVWMHNSSDQNAILNVEINGEVAHTAYQQIYQVSINDQNAYVAGDWTLVYVDFELPEGLVSPQGGEPIKISIQNPQTASGNAYFDDLRIQPSDASVNVYIYDEVRENILYQIDNNNIYTRYVYDAGGRLKETYVETTNGEKVISKTAYKLGAN